MAEVGVAQAQTVLPRAEPGALGLDPERLEQLYRAIEAHIAEGRYPGGMCQNRDDGRVQGVPRAA